jgi:tetratricopeptide (TPR) repeat protein/predicted phosphodiesterase
VTQFRAKPSDFVHNIGGDAISSGSRVTVGTGYEPGERLCRGGRDSNVRLMYLIRVSVTWLHVSDFHIRSGDPYDRDVVLRALVQSVAEYCARGRNPDLIFATGDVAHAGKPAEYELATKFFDDLLTVAKLDKRHLFVIPGNHDVDRDFGIGLARTLESREHADAYFRPGLPKPHLTFKLRAFLRWHNAYFKDVRTAPDNSTCSVETIEVNGLRFGLLLINTALFCQDDDDHDKLWVGRRCLGSALEQLKAAGGELNIALMHHPLEWLSTTEGSNIRSALESSIHILLRGHLHETRVETIASMDGQVLHCAAGAAYQSRKWPNRALYTTLDGAQLRINPIRYEDAPREIWTTDPSVFPREPEHAKSFAVPQLTAFEVDTAPLRPAPAKPAPLARFRSNVPARGNRPFVGREKLIAEIRNKLRERKSDCVLVLHGQPGVGKSELAREFARLHRDLYPGGTFFIDASKDAIAIDFAHIGKVFLDLTFTPDLAVKEQSEQTFYSLGGAPTLLIYDNASTIRSLEPWTPPAGMPCHVLVTMVPEIFDPAWQCIQVPPLSFENSLELIEQLAGPEVADRYGVALANQAGGLPVQIAPAAASLAYEQRRGRLEAARIDLAPEAAGTFRAVYERLGQNVRLLLHGAAFLNPQRIVMQELSYHLRTGLAWNEAELGRSLDTCLDFHLLEGVGDLRMHQLFNAFLWSIPLPTQDRDAIVEIRSVQRRCFVQHASALTESPSDAEVASTFMSYRLDPEGWVTVGQPLSINEHVKIGEALCAIGCFYEALPWVLTVTSQCELSDENGIVDHPSLAKRYLLLGYCLASIWRYEEAQSSLQRAIMEAEKGDVHGRVDHELVGSSLHEIGYCFLQKGDYEEARLWFERAGFASQMGDVYGRVDHARVSSSLHETGHCLVRLGRFEDARPWFERALAEAQEGDVHGRIDPTILGSNLHLMGYCVAQLGQHEEARLWFERSAVELEKGDLHGRVDHDKLGSSLHLLGYSIIVAGRYGEAQRWFEKAVEAKQKGDVHGRVDHDNLSRSLASVGNCLVQQQQIQEARLWFERAVTEAEKGDMQRRISYESLGRCLHEVGQCFASAARFEEARPWFERAVEAKQKGDVHGRIDHDSLIATLRAGAACFRILNLTGQAEEWERRASDVEAISAADANAS